ncbi:hypothetical protein D3C81_2038110 [compost metagenome]
MSTMTSWIGRSKSFGFTQSVAPSCLAISNFAGLMSMAMMRAALALTAPMTADRPMPPRPKMATVSPGFTLAVLSTAPIPVVTPQPSRQTFSSGASLAIFATEISGSTVYSENVEVPM